LASTYCKWGNTDGSFIAKIKPFNMKGMISKEVLDGVSPLN
jgi:hypothetical protein